MAVLGRLLGRLLLLVARQLRQAVSRPVSCCKTPLLLQLLRCAMQQVGAEAAAAAETSCVEFFITSRVVSYNWLCAGSLQDSVHD
jgi:hypothetical protein